MRGLSLAGLSRLALALRGGQALPGLGALSVGLSLAGCAAPALASSAGSTQSLTHSFSAGPLAQSGLTVLWSFAGYPDGANPEGGVIVAKGGKIFGTTYAGGAISSPGYGTVFELEPAGKKYNESILTSYTGADGAFPSANPIEDASGDLYVTTQEGGPSGGNGTVTELSPAGDGYSVTGSYAFPSNGGSGPRGPLLLHGGTLYAAVYTDYANNHTYPGGIYALGAGLSASDLYEFTGSPDGASPIAPLVEANDGLYGTTELGGTGTCSGSGCGTVFRYVLGKKGAGESVLWNFQGPNSGGSDGAFPYGGVVIDKSGNIYGTTAEGGADGDGTVFKLTKTSGGYAESILHAFSGSIKGGPDGGAPLAGLTLKGSLLYGTTSRGGSAACSCGTIFQISTTGSNYSVLHSFSGSDGALPFYGSLVLKGNALYGTTAYGGNTSGNCSSQGGCGVVYRYIP